MAPCSRANVSLGAPFRDGAIVQRGKDLTIWGTAAPGERVHAEFRGRSAQTVARADGRWQVGVGQFDAAAEAARLIVTGQNTVAVENVLVGDVWLCSGQSNMFFPVKAAQDGVREISSAQHPLIRQFAPKPAPGIPAANEFDVLVRSNLSDTPRDSFDGEWKTCSPATVGQFTAVGYFFARELQRSLGNVPVGIIKATLGGSPIEGWISEAALKADPAFATVAQRWEELRPKVKDIDDMRRQPSVLYNGMIHPLEPFRLAGVLWYQGESNAVRADEYPRLFAAMIRQWRQDFGQGDLPFVFVQLPNFGGKFAGPGGNAGTQWAREREAQATALSLPNVHMVVTIDIGDPNSLHPTNKQEVGRRAALVARANVYGEAVEDRGPVFTAMTRQRGSLRLTFSHAGGLHFSGDPSRIFELAGADRKFIPARAEIKGESIVLSAEGVANPAAVRCEWCNAPEAWLVNAAGLPAAPFRTDEE
jgi:sialate O-acetylesterase